MPTGTLRTVSLCCYVQGFHKYAEGGHARPVLALTQTHNFR